MKNIFLLLICMVSLSGFKTDNEQTVWQLVSTKTWMNDDMGMGASLVFYHTKTSEPKAILQMHGSGFMTVASLRYTVSHENGVFYLSDPECLDKPGKSFEGFDELTLTYDSESHVLTSGSGEFKPFNDTPTVYRHVKGTIPFEKVVDGDLTPLDF